MQKASKDSNGGPGDRHPFRHARLGERIEEQVRLLRMAAAHLGWTLREIVRTRRLRLGLRSHLILFGLAIVIPVLLYSAILLHRYTQSERASYERRALGVARAISSDIDREITAIITTLEALATSPSLAARDFDTFREQAMQALRSRPSWNIVLIDADRQQWVNTRLPPRSILPKSQQPDPMSDVILETRKPFISNLFMGTAAGRLIFAVGVPVRVGNDVPFALVMSLDPDRLVEILQSPELPEGWLAAVADRRNINMARSRDAKQFIGKLVPDESVRQYAGRSEGVIISTDFDGRRSLQAFHWSAVTGWRIAAWAPVSQVEAPLRRAWRTFLMSGVALLGLSLLLAIGTGRMMSAPIADLMRAGAALGHGERVKPLTSTLREADELSNVLADAAQELEARTGAQAHLATIVSSSPSAMIGLSPEGVVRTWNPAAETLFGYAASEVIGKSVEMFYADEERPDFARLNADVRAGKAVQRDVQRKHKSGQLIDVAISVAPMYDDAGRLVGISSIVSDISERKAREKHIELLMRELSHRSKNLLAVIQAIAGQTARYTTTMDDFQARFAQRLAAMARAQDLLVARSWEGALVTALVRSQLAPFTEDISARIEMSGAEFDLKPDAVHSLTLALHELATNAAKYGALSVPDGKVAVAWRLDDDGGADGLRFRMVWQERHGPPVRPPEHKGFGHVVIADMVAHALRGKVELAFETSGLRWSLDVPATAVLGRSGRG